MSFLRLLPLVLLLSSSLLQAQTADEIIEKYVAAIGGRTRVDSLQAFVCSYELSSGNKGISYYQRPNLARNEINSPATDLFICTGYDGNEGWMFNNKIGKQPFRLIDRFPGINDGNPLGQPFISFLINPVEQGFVVNLVGKMTLDSTVCFELRLLHPEAEKEFHFFLDATTFLIRRSRRANLKKDDIHTAPDGTTIDRSENKTETVYSDYRRFDGILFPMRQISTLNGQFGDQVTDIYFKNYKKILPADVRLFQCFPDVPAPKFD